MSDEQEQTERPFGFNIPKDNPPDVIGMLIGIQASVDALAGMLFHFHAKDDAELADLSERYTRLKKDLVLRYAFKLQDTPPADPGEAEEGSHE